MLDLALVAGLLVAIAALMAGCAPTGTATGGETSSLITMVAFLVGLFAVFYFLMIRPQRKRQKEHNNLLQSLQKGDKVITIGGAYGEIQSIDEDSVVLKVESGVSIRFARDAIGGKVRKA